MLGLCVCPDPPGLQWIWIKRRSVGIKIRTNEGNEYVKNDASHLHARQKGDDHAKRVRPQADDVAIVQQRVK